MFIITKLVYKETWCNTFQKKLFVYLARISQSQQPGAPRSQFSAKWTGQKGDAMPSLSCFLDRQHTREKWCGEKA